MNAPRGRSGKLVARGKIRVDARRAVAKLREHLLVDLHDYTLEIARAAVASGAERIDVSYDADDVVMSWCGAPLGAGALSRLLDHVLIEASDRQAQRLRLLALGVNAALGLGPAWVDIHTVAGGRATRLRFAPRLIREGGEEAAPEAIETAPPPGARDGSVRVHLRRKVGWHVLRRAAVGGAPKEIEALLRVSEDLPVALWLHGERWQPSRTPALLSAALNLSPGRDPLRRAVIELRAAGDARACIDFLEQGVRLASYRFEPSRYQLAPKWGCALPVRVVVDGDMLPTNASRSAVREDAPLFAQVVEAAEEGFHRLLRALRALVPGCDGPGAAAEGDPLAGVTRHDGASDQALHDALGTLTCMALAGAEGRAVSPDTLALMATPVLRDGCGRPLSYLELARDDPGAPIYVHRGDTPIDEALAHWMRNVVWVDGRVAERALDGYEMVEAAPLVARAREALARRRQLLAHAPGKVAVPGDRAHLVRESFAVSEGPYAGLRGEVAIRGSGPPGCNVRVFWEGRELAARNLPPEVVALPLDIAFEWDRLSITFGFDDVADDRALRSAIWYAVCVGIMQARDLAARIAEQPDVPEALCRALRSAIATAAMGRGALGLPERYEPPPVAGDPLDAAPVWPTTARGWVSQADIRREIARRGALCVTSPRRAGRAVDGRMVLRLAADERVWLEASLGQSIRYVDYAAGILDERALDGWPAQRPRASRALLDEELARQQVAARCALWFCGERVAGWVAVAEEPAVVWSHLGRPLCREPMARAFGPAVVIADDDSIVPNADWTGYHARHDGWSHEHVEKQLLVTLVAAYEGDADAIAAMGEGFEPQLSQADAAVRLYLLRSAIALREALETAGVALRSELEPLFERACSLPLLRMCDLHGRAVPSTLAAAAEAHPPAAGAVPLLAREPGFETWDWRPLVASSWREREALRQWFRPHLHEADDELEARRHEAARERGRRRLLERPQVDPAQLGDLAPSHAPIGHAESEDGRAAVALAPAPDALGSNLVELCYLCRPVARVALEPPLGIVARVSLDGVELFDDLARLSPAGERAAQQLVAQAAANLITGMLRSRGDEVPSPMLDGRVLATILTLLRERARLAVDCLALRNALRQAARYPTVQGDARTLRSLRRDGVVYAGHTRYEPWLKATRGRTSLDKPILWLPHSPMGQALAQLLGELDVSLRDVSAAVARLQQRRGGHLSAEIPRLGGTPIHPALRVSASELGDGTLEGDVELVAGDRSELMVIDLHGESRTVPLPAPPAIRALVRSDEIASEQTDASIAARVQRIGESLLLRASRHFDELPDWVRSAYRERIAARLEAGRALPAAMSKAAVFRDVRGGWHAIRDLCDTPGAPADALWVTRSAPPYPELEEQRLVLCLDAADIARFAGYLGLEDVTEAMERARAAEARRRAPPRERFELGEVRAQCLHTRAVSSKKLRGELGILAPEHAAARAIEVYVGGRPLCTLAGEESWPIAAVVDVDDVRPNRYFDGMRSQDAARVTRALAVLADEVLAEWLAAPAGAAADHWLDVRVLDSDGGRTCIAGRFWLERGFPADPFVEVRAPGLAGGAAKVRLRRLFGISGMDLTLPVFGSLLVLPSSPNTDMHHLLADAAMDAALAMLPRFDAGGGARGMLRWSLALLGAELDPPPYALSLDRREIVPAQIHEELRQRRRLWVAGEADRDRLATLEDRPDFVLLEGSDDGLLEVLRLRAPGLVTRLGDLAPPGAAPAVEDAAPAPVVPPPVHHDDDAEEIVESWWSGLTRRVLRVLADPPAPAPVTRSLRELLEASVQQLSLSGSPVSSLRFSRSGRPVRFDPRAARIIVNRDHPAVRPLLDVPDHADAPNRTAVQLLMAAIVSELNRAHASVTSSAEKQALLDLLRTTRA